MEEQAASAGEEAAAAEQGAATSAGLPAKEAIAQIREMTDLDALEQFLAGEERVTVRRAGDTRKAELAAPAEG
jgi:hypothetical protein